MDSIILYATLIFTAFIVGGDGFLFQPMLTTIPRRSANTVKCWESTPKYFLEFLKQQQADRAADKADLENRRFLELLSKKLSVLLEESVRSRVARRNGESWAEPIIIQSLEDLVESIFPLLVGISFDSKSSRAYNDKKNFALLLARQLRPFLRLYMDAIKDFLSKYYYANTEKMIPLSKMENYNDLPGRLIGLVGEDNETWKRRLLRLKEASHLINLEDPSDEQLEALLSPSGPGNLLACGAAKEMYRQRQQTAISRFHRNNNNNNNNNNATLEEEVSNYHLGNPFIALSDPFVGLKEEIEGDHAGECELIDRTVVLSVGEMESSGDDISEARGQIALVLSIYEWAFETIISAADRERHHHHHHHHRYEYIRRGDIYIPKTAKRSKDNQDASLYANNGIHFRVFYI